MELNKYQRKVIGDFQTYLSLLKANEGKYVTAYREFWENNALQCPEDNRKYNDTIKDVPHICFKVPTAGGKTFIACNAVHTYFDTMEQKTNRAVVWLVPSNAILQQTYDALNNPKHPYRQKLDMLFGGRVRVYNKDELMQAANFNPVAVAQK